MSKKPIQPYVLGRGRAAQALMRSYSILKMLKPKWALLEPVQLDRHSTFDLLTANQKAVPVLFVANPHGLHADVIIKAAAAGVSNFVVEKPAVVSLDEVTLLRALLERNSQLQFAVCHGYRQTWGLQTLKKKIDQGDLGELIAVEGRYWQSSTAQRKWQPSTVQSWKNDVKLSGHYDALLDIAPHWVDALCFLTSAKHKLSKINKWMSYKNAEAAHRDTHIQLLCEFTDDLRAMASISKTVHGASNFFEIVVMGTLKTASWNFLNPDEIQIGVASKIELERRLSTEFGSGQSPFHATGWLEGYVEILKNFLAPNFEAIESKNYPSLPEHLMVMEGLLK